MLRSRLGLGPLDLTNAGLANHLGLAVGTCSWISATVLVGLAWGVGRRPKLGTLAEAFLVGLAINQASCWIGGGWGLGQRWAMLGVGIVVLYVGISAVVVANYGAGPPEELMLALVGRGLALHRARWGIEATLFVIGWALGGVIGVGTVVIVAATGPVLSWSIPRAARVLALEVPVYGGGVPPEDIR